MFTRSIYHQDSTKIWRKKMVVVLIWINIDTVLIKCLASKKNSTYLCRFFWKIFKNVELCYYLLMKILYFCTQLVHMNYTTVNTTHLKRTHTHMETALYIYLNSFTDLLYYCTQLVQMDCTSNFCEHNCTLLYKLMLPANTAGAHTVLWTVVLLYVFTVDQSLYVCAVNLCWPMRGQAILRVGWSAVLSINKASISSCMTSKQLSSQNNSSFRGPGSWVLYCNAWRLSSGSWGLYLVHEGYIYWFKVINISYSMFTTSLPRERDM